MAPLQHGTMFANQSKCPLLRLKPGAFLDTNLGAFGGPTESGEHGDVGVEPHSVVPPVAGGDHAAVKVEDTLKLYSVKGGDGPPVPRMRKRRDDAQALLTFGWG